jgi:PAS domain S-box-containing protein
MQTPARLLLLDENAAYLRSLQVLFTAEGYHATATGSAREAAELIERLPFDLVLLDPGTRGVAAGDLLGRIRSLGGNIKTLIVTAETSSSRLVPMLRAGASDCLTRPCPPEQLTAAVRNLLERKRLEDENARMQRQVEASDQLHRYLVDHSPDLIFMLDEGGRFSFVNDRCASILGMGREQLLGQHWSLLFDADGAALARHHFDERRTGERATSHLELRLSLPQPDGTARTCFVELTAQGIWRNGPGGARVFAGTYGVARDVTARRRAAAALAATEEKFHGLIDSSPDAIFTARIEDGRLLECNASFRTMLRTVAPDSDLQTDTALWPDQNARRYFIDRLHGSPERLEHEIVTGTGSNQRVLSMTARALQIDGAPGFIASLRDLSAQRVAEIERLELEGELQQARKLEAIGQLAGGIAHDFNNILASIIGFTELAMLAGEGTPAEQRREYLRQVIIAGNRARDLIAQLLSFGRAHRTNAREIQLRDEIEAAASMLRATIPKSIDLATGDVDAALPSVVMDPVHLQQVLVNLCVNARNAISGYGAIRIGAGLRQVRARCASCGEEVDGEWLAITVADTGSGIDPALRPRVFDRFVSGRAGGRGTGMGLTVTHSVVHDYGGHILLDSTPGHGTTFAILLPVAATRAVDAGTAARGQGTVLVVDDEASVANFVAEALRTAGFATIVCHDADAAFERVCAADGQLALVITDQTMPRQSGLELAARVRARDPGLPIVLMTGFDNPVRDDPAAGQHIDRLLMKPFRMDELVELAREAIGQRRVAGAPLPSG